jgi:hypothetical protein
MDTERYRVLPGPEDGTCRLLDRESYEPVVVSTAQDQPVADLRPGYLVEAGLDWGAERPTVTALSVVRPTLYAFATDIDPVFEAAQETWADAQATGDAMNSRVTRNTDGEVNGVVYVFAEGDVRSRLEEFQEGARPLEPLVDRVNDEGEPAPREVFVLRPPAGDFVVVTIALRKGGQLGETVRDTYDCPAPEEPLLD